MRCPNLDPVVLIPRINSSLNLTLRGRPGTRARTEPKRHNCSESTQQQETHVATLHLFQESRMLKCFTDRSNSRSVEPPSIVGRFSGRENDCQRSAELRSWVHRSIGYHLENLYRAESGMAHSRAGIIVGRDALPTGCELGSTPSTENNAGRDYS